MVQEPLWVHHHSEIQEWVLAPAWTVPGSQGSPSNLLPLCLVLDNTFTRTSPFHFLCLADCLISHHKSLPWHPILTPDRAIGTCSMHQPALVLTIVRMLIIWFIYLVSQPDCELLRALVFCSLYLEYPSILASLFHQLENSASDKSHPPGRCLWPSQSMSSIFYSCALWFMSLSWDSPCASVVYLFRHKLSLIDYVLIEQQDLEWFFFLSPRAKHGIQYPDNTLKQSVELNSLTPPYATELYKFIQWEKHQFGVRHTWIWILIFVTQFLRCWENWPNLLRQAMVGVISISTFLSLQSKPQMGWQCRGGAPNSARKCREKFPGVSISGNMHPDIPCDN